MSVFITTLSSTRCSNGGFLFLGTLMDALAAPRAKSVSERSALCGFAHVLENTAGVIIDSAPSHLTPDIAARGSVSAALGLPAENIEKTHPRQIAFVERVSEAYLARKAITARIKQVGH